MFQPAMPSITLLEDEHVPVGTLVVHDFVAHGVAIGWESSSLKMTRQHYDSMLL